MCGYHFFASTILDKKIACYSPLSESARHHKAGREIRFLKSQKQAAAPPLLSLPLQVGWRDISQCMNIR